jgi:hypothetical protein
MAVAELYCTALMIIRHLLKSSLLFLSVSCVISFMQLSISSKGLTKTLFKIFFSIVQPPY